MRDLLDAQALIQLEADKVVRLLGLDDLLSRVGRPTRVEPLMTIENRVDPHERRRRDGTFDPRTLDDDTNMGCRWIRASR